jgi:signal transduction histidine kinase
VDGLNRIVTSFLSYARPGGETPEECDVNQICLAAIAISAPELEKHGVEGLTHLPRPPLRTRTFPGRLRQVLVNLIHNAAQACGPGHRVTIHGSQRGRTLRISVEDDGPGLPDEIRSHLFEPFHTSRKDGTGLGLAICHRLISDMNGKITYEPARPRGSVFILEIPSVPGDEKAGPRTK